MLGFQPIATFPIADIEDTVVDIVIQRDSKIKIWNVPSDPMVFYLVHVV